MGERGFPRGRTQRAAGRENSRRGILSVAFGDPLEPRRAARKSGHEKLTENGGPLHPAKAYRHLKSVAPVL